MSNILITGGTGLVGSSITQILIEQGHQVAHLTRKKEADHEPSAVKKFSWDLHNNFIDKEAITWADHVIHLAGESVAGQRWTSQKKEKILKSRVEVTRLLQETIASTPNNINSFVSASAIGAYGADLSAEVADEDSPFAEDFLAQVVEKWESEIKQMESLSIRTVILRIGLVLDKSGGALPKMATPIKLGVGAPIGSGKQMMSWIHIQDLADLFVKASFDESMEGIYNAVAPEVLSNKAFTQTLAKELNKPLLLPNVPGFVFKAIFGEMSIILLGGRAVSSAKLLQTGFQPQFKSLAAALSDIYKNGDS
jgi:uncharacterized protein (TIGR01777 family)